MPPRPPASISLDLDNLWAYLKTHGDPKWTDMPSFLDVAVPRFLEFFRNRRQSITVFVVGADAALETNSEVLASIADAGHEIGNHSFHHEPWLHRYTQSQLIDEIERTEESVWNATGQVTRGFRGPGFSCPPEMLAILAARGYEYDASVFPTFLGPLARAWYFWHSRFNSRQKRDRNQLFGKFVDGFQSVKPWLWSAGDRQLVEIPVTTMPVFKLPVHASYVNYLARFSTLASRWWFRTATSLCALTKTQPSLLLHALDFIDDTDCPQMGFFPGVRLPVSRKLELLNQCLDMIDHRWQASTMRNHARVCRADSLICRPVNAPMPDATAPSRSVAPLQSTCKPS